VVLNKRKAGDMASVFADGSIEAFTAAIKAYKDEIAEFNEVPRYADVGMLLVDSTASKADMTPSPLACLLAVQKYLPVLSSERAQALLDILGTMNPIIGGDPPNVDAFVVKKKTRDAANARIEEFREEQSYVRQIAQVMEDNDWPLPDNVKALSRMLREALPLLENNMQTAEGKEEEEIKKFSELVTSDVPKLNKQVQQVREDLDHQMIGDPLADEKRVTKYLDGKVAEFARYRGTAEKLQEYQGILKLNVDEFENIDDVAADLNLKVRLWNDKVAWIDVRETALKTQMNDLDIVQFERELAKYNKTAFMASKGLPSNKVVPKFKSEVEEFNPILPVVTNLRNPCLKDRHWDEIIAHTGVDIRGAEDFSLADLIDQKVTDHEAEIAKIATSAQQESILEEMMAKIAAIWQTSEFQVLPYKDVKDLYVLGDTSEVVANLDDSLVTINTVLGSRYVAGIRPMVDKWRATLMHFQETLDEWQTCQRTWMYLETIFGSADIIRQLPGPAKTFQTVDKSWKFIMKKTNDEPNALKCATNDKTLLGTFRNHNANLDQIQKDLEDYLETKRMAFPRFYFLSNDELLEILSQAKEPRAVQPHMRKCFDNLIKLEFGSEEGSVDLLGMYSGEGEYVPLGKNLKARGNVEEWLLAVEKRMKETLHAAMKHGLLDYDTKKREEWLLMHPGQIVATVAQMTWARDTERALKSATPIQSMLQWSSDYKEDLQKVHLSPRACTLSITRTPDS
jgi:dynein heavy chain